MAVTSVSDVRIDAHVEALRAKHRDISNKIEDAQKDLSTTDFFLSQLKKEKLVIKEQIASEETRTA